MGKKTIAALVLAGGIGAAFCYYAGRPEDSKYRLQDARFEECVRNAVTITFPDAKGGLRLGSEIIRGNDIYRDHLFYRSRGIDQAHTVIVVPSLSDESFDVVVNSRKSTVVLLPGIALPDSIVNQRYIARHERRYGFSGNSIQGMAPPKWMTKDETANYNLVSRVLRCGPVWKD